MVHRRTRARHSSRRARDSRRRPGRSRHASRARRAHADRLVRPPGGDDPVKAIDHRGHRGHRGSAPAADVGALIHQGPPPRRLGASVVDSIRRPGRDRSTLPLHRTDMPSYSATLLLLSLAAAPIRAQSPAAADTGVVRGQMGAALDQLLSRLAAYGLSGAMLVAKGDTVVLHRGYGLANRAANAPVAPETPFMIGSLSKQITAAAIVKLEAERKLAKTDTLGKFFPGLPPEKARITLHQLLTHTAGFPYLDPNMFAEVSRDEAVRGALALPLDRQSGERYAYASPGYTILAGVVERASGETFEAYLTKHLLEPAGMRRTGFMGEARWRDPGVPTHSYSDANDEGAMSAFPGMAKAVGAGSIITTAGDLFRWERALRGGALLPDSVTRKLWAPHVPTGQGP